VLFSWAKSQAFTLGEGLTHDPKTKNPPQRFLKGTLVGLLVEDVGDVQHEVKGQVSTSPQNHKAEESCMSNTFSCGHPEEIATTSQRALTAS
jgi:hypothetical protein